MIDRRNISNLYPLSSLQEGMLYHAMREPSSRAYFEQIDFEAPRGLNAQAYQQAWQDLVARHDILRTVFPVRKLAQPLQVVLREAPLTILYEDLRALPQEAALARIAACRAASLDQGFDLGAAVPMRLALFALADGRHRVVWSFHHILLDGWSLAVLQAELDTLYAARLAGRSAGLPPAPPFSAYIKWLSRRERQEGLDFWQRRLQGLSQATPVPRRLDARFAPRRGEHEPGECCHRLGEAAQAALPRLAASQGVTVNIVVQCLWGLMLARLHGRNDAAFAATVSGRPPELPGAGRTVGLFINAVPVRIAPHAGESIAALLARVQVESIDAQHWHDCPLAEVQAAHPLRGALFDHILVFENYPQLSEPAEAAAEPDTVHLHEYTHYDFEFQFLPGTPPVLRFRFNRALFDPASMAAMARGLETMLLAADADPQGPARQLLLPPAHARAPATLALAASFTAEPVAEALSWWLAQMACPTEVRLAPYNQCLQQLADGDSVLRQCALGVLLLRFEDSARDLAAMPVVEACARLEAQYDMLLAQLARRGAAPLLVAMLPQAPQGALAGHVLALQERWRAAVQDLPGVALLDLRELGASHGIDQVFDSAADRLGHLPYSSAAFEAIAGAIARATVARARAPFKVIAVDCDNTLWAGVVGEAGPLGVRIEAGHRQLQQFLLERQREGFLIALASKNQEQDVWAVFDQHPDMLLKREHIASAMINWLPKSGNLKQMAASLNLGVDSMIFIDDSALECTEVMENCPQAFAIALPADPALYASWLARCWAFDVTDVTDEDRARSAMMQAESARQSLAGDTPLAFLEQLQLRIKVGPVQPHQLARVAQLTQRTNQFNLSGKRRDAAAIAALVAEPGVLVLAVEVDDRFGAYGLTGVVIARSAAQTLDIDTLLLSCRVLGRQVEHALLAALARRALALGHAALEAQLVGTDRNEPVRLFLDGPPWRHAGAQRYSCEAALAAAIVTSVDVCDDVIFCEEAEAEAEAAAAAAQPAATEAGATAATGSAVAWGAFPLPIRNEAQLRHAAQYLPLLAACAGWPGQRLQPAAVGAARTGLAGREPAGTTEQRIAAVWTEVLGAPVVDAEAHFSDLGGHSLHAVRAVSRLERAFQLDVGLARFFELGSIAALADWIAQQATPAGAAHMVAIARADDADDYPLSHNQQRLWVLGQLGGAGNQYNLCAAFLIQGALDTDALGRAVRQLVQRHEALRTVVCLRDEQPRQRFLDQDCERFALMTHGAQSEAQVRAHIEARSGEPFDLAAGPLFRCELHALEDKDPASSERHVLAIYLHHIVGDGWSFGLMLGDLALAYSGQIGEGGALRYRDFAVWNRSAAAEADMARHRAYWLAQLRPLEPIAQLAPDRARAGMPDGTGASILRAVPVPLSQLHSWLSTQRSNLYPLLASLVSVLLYRCGSEAAVRLGMPVAGRDRPELEQTVGFFANTTVLDARVAGDAPFAALLAQMQQRVNGALEHQAYPFERLVAELQPEREAGRNPLFDVMVALQNARSGNATLAGLAVSDFPVESALAAFDLVFEFAETGPDELSCALRYRCDLYRPSSVQRMLDRLMVLLAGVLENPATPIDRLALIGPAERQQLDRFSDGGARAVAHASLHALFARQAAATPDAIALLAGGQRVDYRTLDQRANALAWQLRDGYGIKNGDIVAVMLERGPDWPVALLATLKAGATYLPLDLHHPVARRHDLLRQAGASVVIAAPAHHSDVAELPLRVLVPPPCGAGIRNAPPDSSAGDSVAYLIFTSGSTGVPKGVRVQHSAFVNMIAAQIDSFALTPADVVLQLASCAFDASLSEFFMAWLCGASVAVADHASTRDSALLGEAIGYSGATVATLTPSHLRQLDDADIASLRKVILAAEAVYGADARRLHRLGIECFNAYGPTETAVCATLGRITAAAGDADPVPIGRPLANLRVRIVEASGEDAALGLAGEMVVLGAGVALGYLHAPDDAPSPFFTHADGSRAYRTGDLARWRDDGSIEYIGRRDGELKIRGHRVAPAEVAAALNAQDGVHQAEVLAEQGEAGAHLVAYLCGEVRPDSALRLQLSRRLPAHMMPARFVWLQQMPLNSSGKLDRAALAACTPIAQPAPVQLAPAGATETVLLALWREALPGALDVDTDFFGAGGDSLLAMTLARRVAQRLGSPCPALQFFLTPTVRTMAAALAAHSQAQAPARFGHGELALFALPPHPGLDFGYARLARALPEVSIYAPAFADRDLALLIDDYRASFQATADGAAVLLGYSGGGKLALALAHALERQGTPVRAVILLDTWDWSAADAAVHARIEAETVLALPDQGAAGAAYRARIAAFTPHGVLKAPVYHVQAGAGPEPSTPGLTRNWRHLAGTGSCDYRLAASHHQLLDAGHVAATAHTLRAILQQH